MGADTPRFVLPEGVKPRMDRVEVARYFGVTKEAIRHTEVKALLKLQRWCRARGLELSDFITDERI